MKFEIPNYESMSAEEKVAALEAYEPDMSGFVAKTTFDKTASDLAAAKKSLREKMSAEEAKAIKDAEERQALIDRAEKAERELGVINYEKAYLAMGYDEKLARSSAEALANGDMESVFKNQKIHADTREKALRTELLKATPTPAPGKTDNGMTKEQFSKLTLAEKAEFAEKNPDIYKEFYGG